MIYLLTGSVRIKAQDLYHCKDNKSTRLKPLQGFIKGYVITILRSDVYNFYELENDNFPVSFT